MNRLMVGFSGYARSGKDSAGAALQGWHHASFAAKLKAFLYAVNPPIVQNDVVYQLARLVDAYGWEKVKDDFPMSRTLLQRTGTDAGRKVLWDNVWVDAAMRDLTDDRVFFTDCRFPNEADAIRAGGGIVVRVDRPGVGPGLDDKGEVHVSEVALDDYAFDARIVNDGSLGDLHAKVRALVTAYADTAPLLAPRR